MTTPDMHAALARLVNNEQTRKQEKIDQSLPKRSSREAELSPRERDQDTADAPLGIVVAVAVVVAAVAREAPRLGRAQVGGVGARRDESNE